MNQELEKSINAHLNAGRSENRNTRNGMIKFAYHMNVANKQRNEKRLLTQSERKKIWGDNVRFGNKYWGKN